MSPVDNQRRRADDASDDALRELIREAVRDAVRDAVPDTNCLMSAKQHAWVDLAIEREARREAFQRAVIEKTLLGLIWAGLVTVFGAIALVAREYMIAHGMWRP